MSIQLTFDKLRTDYLQQFYDLLKEKNANDGLTLNKSENEQVICLIMVIDRCSMRMEVEPRLMSQEKDHPNQSILFCNYLKAVEWYGF
jgi:hypothetical protein